MKTKLKIPFLQIDDCYSRLQKINSKRFFRKKINYLFPQQDKSFEFTCNKEGYDWIKNLSENHLDY